MKTLLQAPTDTLGCLQKNTRSRESNTLCDVESHTPFFLPFPNSCSLPAGPSAKRLRPDADPDPTPAAAMDVDEAPAKQDVVYEDFEGYSPQLMQQFYRRLFPFPEMVRWLSYGHKKNPHPMFDENYLQRREISMTLDGDIFVRYQSFKNADEMAKTIRARNPLKIDIGAVFNVDVRGVPNFESLSDCL